MTKYFFVTIGIIVMFTSCGQKKEISSTSTVPIDPLTFNGLRIDTSSFISFELKNNLKDSIKLYTVTQPKKDCNLLLYNFIKHDTKNKGWSIATPWRGPNDYDTIIIPPNKSKCFYLDINTKHADTIFVASHFDFLKKGSLFQRLHWCFKIDNNKVSLFNADSNAVLQLNHLDKVK